MKNLTRAQYIKLLLLLVICKLTGLHAQVLVHEEPRHKPVFQNKAIRILDVLLPPADTTLYHLHRTPSLFIFFTSSSTGSRLQGKSAVTGKSTAGNILFENLAPPHTRVHQVWNIDQDTFHVMDVELLMKDTGFVQAPLTLHGLTLETTTPWIRAYRLMLPTGKTIKFMNRVQPLMLVSFSNAAIQTSQHGEPQSQILQAGNFIEIKKNDSFTLKNIGSNTVQFALLELPEQ